MEPMVTVAPNHDDHLSALSRFAQDSMSSQPRKQSGKRVVREADVQPRKRSSHGYVNNVDARRAAELRAIAAVEAQLGEPLKDDCPMLGVEFDQLPSRAFETYMPTLHIHGATPAVSHGVDRTMLQYAEKSAKGPHGGIEGGYQNTMPSVAFSAVDQVGRARQEYQFLPEQPVGRLKMEEKPSQSSFYLHASTNSLQSLAPSGSLVRGNEPLAAGTSGVGSHAHMITAAVDGGRLSQSDGCGSTGPVLTNSVLPSHVDKHSTFGAFDDRFASNNQASFQLLPSGGSLMGPESYNLLPEEEQAKMEKKRLQEEARIAKEVELHEKRIRREIERQDLARKKREEQLRKDIERQRREAEKVVRERQREEERILREHRREIERQERIMEKETKRVERQRLKDESRRLKEQERVKVASERAIAKRLAKETMDLIDDERLELLEVAAAAQGLPSIYLLDGETLSELDRYKGFLKKFPLASVKLKVPIAVYPWIASKAHVGNLLMVWRFLNTFADILGLWPFTLDEFVQAFHDYDPRLLGEVHIALLRTLVKDVEDVGRASASGGASNQYAPAFSGGGHPLLVEAAFSWGFDIFEWKRHLNPQTWPEILRQFALAAGYGPIWKKESIETNSPCEDEGKECHEIIHTLRSGMAVEKAVSQMQGRARRRRKRHRLTPGTVKFAAFHVLSLEDQDGLSILEVAERIQRSGLRDLTTSKTPEASIAAALSRDTKLFERVAPSTYCVRAPFRKDPEDAESILQAAREKVHLFQNMNNQVEDPDKETEFADEGEREEESDEDMEDVDGDDLEGTLPEEDTEACCPGVDLERSPQVEELPAVVDVSLKDPQDMKHKTNLIERVEQEGSQSFHGHGSLLELQSSHGHGSTPLMEPEIDEGHPGEPWLQALMEGDYCDLSVEERLNALVVLVEMVNEGNSVRVALEERMEAASSLRKQLWAEVQLDKRRFKEEQNSRLPVLSDGTNGPITLDHAQDSLFHEEAKCNMLPDIVNAQGQGGGIDSLAMRSTTLSSAGGSNQEPMLAQHQAGHLYDKSRAQLRAEIGLKAEEVYAYRCLPLGFDRRYNRYWQFSTSNSIYDNGSGRIFIESSTDADWHVIDSHESLTALMASLDTRGVQEAQLHEILRKRECAFKEMAHNLNASSCKLEEERALALKPHASEVDLDGGAIRIACGRSQPESEGLLERHSDSNQWMWGKSMNCLNAKRYGTKRCASVLRSCDACHELYLPCDRHCSYCHATMEGSAQLEAKSSQHCLECEKKQRGTRCGRLEIPAGSLPSRMQLLKAEMVAIEVTIPTEAFRPTWTDAQRKGWASKLKLAESPGELLQLVTELEASIHRDWFAPSYETAEELLKLGTNGGNTSILSNLGSDAPPLFPWVPRTTAAVALRLMNMDASLYYTSEHKNTHANPIDSKEPVQLVNNRLPLSPDAQEMSGTVSSSDDDEESDDSMDAVVHTPSRGRGRGGRPRGRSGRASSSKPQSAGDSLTVPKGRGKSSAVEAGGDHQVERGGRGARGRGRGRGGRGRGRGRGGGRGRGRGGRGRVGRGRAARRGGRGRGGGRGGRPSPQLVQREPRVIKFSLSAPQKKPTPKQASKQQSSDGESDHGHEWDGPDHGGEQSEEQYEEFSNEGDSSDSSMEEEIGSEPEQELGSEPEQEEDGMFEYEDDEDVEAFSKSNGAERYVDGGSGEDSFDDDGGDDAEDDDDQIEGGFHGEEDDTGLQSDTSGASG